MQDWHFWTAAGIVLFIIEMISGTFFAASFATACLLTAIVAARDVSLTWQLIAFAAMCVVCIVAVRPLFRGLIYRQSDTTPILSAAMIGQSATVTDEIDGRHGHGRVKVGAEEWRAITENGEGLAAGTRVRILHVDGATLTVSAA